jgi:N-acetylmuramoyl-L-alanine amidase
MERKSTSSAIQVVIPANSNVKVINSFFGDWWEVSYNGKTGYLNSNLLSFNSDSNTTNNHNSGWSNSFYDDKPTYTTTRNAYLREHKSTSSAIQVVIPANSNVKVINSFFGDWWEVSYNGKTGYLNSNLLSFNSDPSTTNNRNSSWSNSFYDDKPTYTTTGNANLREHKSTSSAIQVVIPANSNVKVINSFFGDWWEVSYNGKTGYLNSNLLSFNSDRSTTNNHNSSWSNSFYDDKPTYTTTRNANLREHKSTSSAIQVVIPANSNVKVINSFFGDWWEVYYKGKTGYIPSSLLTK